MTGLSATPVRKDGHQPIITMQCGPVRYRVTSRQLSRTEPFAHVVQVRPTAFRVSLGAAEDESARSFQTVCDKLVADEARNRLIVVDVLRAVSEGRSPVVLTERREHLQRLSDALLEKVKHVVVLRGGLGRKQLAALQACLLNIPENEPRVLLATGRYLGEGFDDARLDTLFLVMPISWRGRIAQYAGRLHRRHSGKHEVRILDYADLSAYRRDRRKDLLLQENGYRVMRFLAEDVCERLGDVLDGILRAMARLEK